MDGGYAALSSSEKAKGKEKVETREASETIIAVEGDEATDIWAKKMLDKIDVVLQKPRNYTASKSISTAPASTEDRDKKLYEPRAVAIGPYHRKTEDNYFRITDEHKLWCVKKVIGNRYEQDLGKFLGKMKEREEDALKFYRERYGTDYLGMESFLEILMLDSCFILFALSFHYGLAKVLPMLSGLTAVPWARRDIVRALDLVKSDLLLLNNQIPFFILEDVFKMKNGGNEGNGSIIEVALNFFDNLGLGRNSSNDTETKEVYHLLHLYHMYLEPPEYRSLNILEDIDLLIDPHRYLPSATELQRKSAVNFKEKKIVMQSVLDVTMDKSGDIQMPALRVEDHTNILLHNLISFEKSDGVSYITAYVAFMDRIVRREEDVELLETSGVLKHRLTSPAEVVALFGQLHNVIDHYKSTPGYLAKVYEEVIRCRNSKWRRMYADAKQRYCSNVWLSISFVAGIALSVAALIQTIYTITGSYKK